MSIAAIAWIAVLLAIAGVAVMRPDGDPAAPPGGGERALAGIFGFFGVGGVPPGLTIAVFASSGAITIAALDLIANLHFGATYPVWFPLDALASGLGVGLLSARLLAASYPRETDPGPPWRMPPGPPGPYQGSPQHLGPSHQSPGSYM